MIISADFFRRLAAAAAAETLPRFRSAGVIVNKLATGFDPVTEADKEAERAIRALISTEYPDHGILGEEHGAQNADSNHQWIIDPIDGTRAFISGIPVWGTLVGLTVDDDALAGFMSQPFTGELFYATGSEAMYEGPGGTRPLELARSPHCPMPFCSRRPRRCSRATRGLASTNWKRKCGFRGTEQIVTPLP